MKQKSIIQYFIDGFYLTNRSLDILLIGLLLSLPAFLSSLMPNSPFNTVFLLMSYIMIFVGIGFGFSLPVFLAQKQQKKKLNYKDVFDVTFKNTRRIILPVALLFILLLILLMLSFVAAGVFFKPSSEDVIQFFKNFSSDRQLIYAILIALMSFFDFAPFFFSLENNSFFKSLKKSIIVSFKNLQFVSVVILISVIFYVLITFIPSDLFLNQLVRALLNQYTALALISSTLFYYQKVIKKH